MDRRRIGGAADQPVKRIDFPNQVALAQAANCRIAAHRPDCGQVEAHQRRARAHARGDRRCFAARMASSHNDDVELAHEGADNRAACQGQREAMFHVKHQLLANAEPPEQGIEHIFGRTASDQRVEAQPRLPQMLRDDERIGLLRRPH